MCVVGVERHHGKVGFAILRGILRNEAREMTACSTQPDCPSFYGLVLPIPCVVEVNGIDFDVRVKGVLF